ncbi:MAG: hypothetical protein Q9187_007728, partial [Circinaria calcarea]
MFSGGLLTVILIPETFKRKEEERPDEPSVETDSLLPVNIQGDSITSHDGMQKQLGQLGNSFCWMKRNVPVLLIVSSFFVAGLGKQVVSVLLQYASKKFHWTYAKAAYLIPLRSGVSLLVLGALIPGLSYLFEKKLQMDIAVKDKRLTQISAMFLVLGCTTTFLASTPITIISGQVLFALGFAFVVTARSLVTSLVEQKHL